MVWLTLNATLKDAEVYRPICSHDVYRTTNLGPSTYLVSNRYRLSPIKLKNKGIEEIYTLGIRISKEE